MMNLLSTATPFSICTPCGRCKEKDGPWGVRILDAVAQI